MGVIRRLVEVAHVRDYVLRVRFSDGTEGEVDLERELTGEVFEPLRDAEYFKGFCLDPDVHTVTWPNGADFAPEFLYEKVKIPA
jgi:hypothetical protein